jgi:hypothetical protein
MTVKLMNEPIIETMTKELDDDEPFIQFDEDTIFEPLEYITYDDIDMDFDDEDSGIEHAFNVDDLLDDSY